MAPLTGDRTEGGRRFGHFSAQCPDHLVTFANKAHVIANASIEQKAKEVVYPETKENDVENYSTTILRVRKLLHL